MKTIYYEIPREYLFELVWRHPLTRLANDFGISDRGLAKVCVRFNIPIPGLGAWRRIETGHRVRKPRLSSTQPGFETVVIKSEVEECLEGFSKKEFEPVAISPKLKKPHELVERTRRIFRSKSLAFPKLTIPEEGCLDVRVTKKSLRRALLIYDAIFKAMEKEGFKVRVVYGGEKVRTVVYRDEGELGISLYEKRREVIREKKTRCGVYRESGYEPTGALVLELDEKLKFSDNKRRTLEQSLSGFLGILDQALFLDAEKRRERKRELLLEKEKRERREEERRRKERLKEELLHFEYRERISLYLNALERENKDPEWIRWVREYGEQFFASHEKENDSLSRFSSSPSYWHPNVRRSWGSFYR